MGGHHAVFVVVLTSVGTAVWSPHVTPAVDITPATRDDLQQEGRLTPALSSDPSTGDNHHNLQEILPAHSRWGHVPTGVQQETPPSQSHSNDVFTARHYSQQQAVPTTSGHDSGTLIVTCHDLQAVPTPSDGNTSIIKLYCDHHEPPVPHDCQWNTINSLKGNCLIHTASQPKRVSSQIRPGERLEHMVSLQRLLYTADVWSGSNDAASLSRMLVAVAEQEMKDCNLVVVYDDGYSEPAVLEDLLLLPNPRQVVRVNTAGDLLGVVWETSGCDGYVFLMDDLSPLLTFTNMDEDHWNYHGRFVFVGVSLEQLEALTGSKKGKKTEHIVGAVKSGTAAGEWTLYMNQLYWGQGVRRVNRWSYNRFASQVDLFPDKLSDLRGAVIKVVTFVWEPNIFYFRSGNGSLLFRYGMDIEVTKTVARTLNFLLAFEEPPNEELWGVQTETGNFTGLLGILTRNEAQVGVAVLYITQERMNIIDYTAPLHTEVSCFMIRSEPPLPRWQALAFPFQRWTWLGILVWLVISGPLLCLLARVSGRCGDEIGSLQTLTFSWYYTFGLHFSEPQLCQPRMASTQVFVMFLWVYTMILTIAYSTNLTAFLVVNKQPFAMETIKEIHGSGMNVASIGVFLKHQMDATGDPHLQSLSKKYHAYNSPKEIFPSVLEGRAVFLINRGFQEFVTATRFTSRGRSRVRIMKECFAPYHIAMGLQNHSPLKRKFDQVIGWIQQSGLLRRFFSDSLQLAASTTEYGGDEGDVEEVLDDGVIPLSLDHLQGIFLVLVMGWLISIILFLVEKSIATQ